MKCTVLLQLLPRDLERHYVIVGNFDFFTQLEPCSELSFFMLAVALSYFPRALS